MNLFLFDHQLHFSSTMAGQLLWGILVVDDDRPSRFWTLSLLSGLHIRSVVKPRVFVETPLRFRTGWVSSLGVAAPKKFQCHTVDRITCFFQNSGNQIPKLNRLNLPRVHPGKGFASNGFLINLSTCTNLGCGPLTVTVTTKIITCLIGNPYKSSFTTVTVRGPHPIPTTFFASPFLVELVEVSICFGDSFLLQKKKKKLPPLVPAKQERPAFKPTGEAQRKGVKPWSLFLRWF